MGLCEIGSKRRREGEEEEEEESEVRDKEVIIDEKK